MYQVKRTRIDRGAACECGWTNSGANRQRAMAHARQSGHRVTYTVEEITIYVPTAKP